MEDILSSFYSIADPFYLNMKQQQEPQELETQQKFDTLTSTSGRIGQCYIMSKVDFEASDSKKKKIIQMVCCYKL